MSKKFAIIGGGAFGTALASVAAGAGHNTMLYLRDRMVGQKINKQHIHPDRLGKIVLPENLFARWEPSALDDRELVLFAVPAQQTRNAACRIAPYLPKATHIVACAKGLEQNSGAFQHRILAECFPECTVLVLSGPGFAKDLAGKQPTALTIASSRIEDADDFAGWFSTPCLRLYSSGDPAGVEAGGALKNVLAIAVGIARGMGLGASAEAALIARGFAELKRLGLAMGGSKQTLAGLSGLGDLVLTCSSPQSRNFSYGMALGRNQPVEGLTLAEGIHMAKTAANIAANNRLEAPIIEAVRDVLDGKTTPAQAVDVLLSRPLRSETG